MLDVQLTINDDIMRVPYMVHIRVATIPDHHNNLKDNSCDPCTKTKIENARHTIHMRGDDRIGVGIEFGDPRFVTSGEEGDE